MQTLSWPLTPAGPSSLPAFPLPLTQLPAGLNWFSFSVSSCLFRAGDFWECIRGWSMENSPVLIAKRSDRRPSQAATVWPQGCRWKEGVWVQILSVMQIRSLEFGACLWLFPVRAERQIPPNTHTLAPASVYWEQPHICFLPSLPVHALH